METSAITVRKSDERSKTVLGRSEATGQYVMRPVSKGGKISLREIRKAVRNATKETVK